MIGLALSPVMEVEPLWSMRKASVPSALRRRIASESKAAANPDRTSPLVAKLKYVGSAAYSP